MAGQTVKIEVSKTTGSQPEEYDLLVLGSGVAGKLTAWTPAKKGMKAAVVERNISAVLVQTSRVFQAKTSSKAPNECPAFIYQNVMNNL